MGCCMARRLACLCLMLTLGCCWASASPTLVSQSAFSGSTVVVGFLSFSSGTLISNQLATLANSGLTFSSTLGGIYANNTYSGQTGVAISATSFAPPQCPCVDETLSFSTPVLRVGFSLFGSNAGTASFTDSNGAAVANVAQFPTEQFIGVQDLAGITSLTIDAPVNQAFVIDTVWIDGKTTPEPGSLLLFGSGVLGLLGYGKRRLGL